MLTRDAENPRGYSRQVHRSQRYRPDRKRATWLLVCACAAFAVVALRLVWLQVVARDYYMENIRPLVTARPATDMATPGSILARDGSVLATSVYAYSLIVDPAHMRQAGESYAGVAQQLAGIIGKDADDILACLDKNKDSRYCLIQQWLSTEQADAIRDARIKGINLKGSFRRDYPNGSLACHIIGARNQFHTPLSGLEYEFRLLIDGRCSAVASGTGSSGPQTLEQEENSLPPVPGFDIELTLDIALQSYVEASLDTVFTRERPKSAVAIVMRPDTGEILAMCARPAFNPNAKVEGFTLSPEHRAGHSLADMRNLCVERDMAPGSTFKVLLAAAALDAGIDPDKTYDCSGSIRLGGAPIKCWGKYGTIGHGAVNMTKMITMSCNTVAARMAVKIGQEKYLGFLHTCGFGAQPNAGFPAEAVGDLPRTAKLAQRDLATMGFGQTVSVSPLQLVAAISAVANRGVKMHPHIISAIYNKDGSVFRRPPTPAPIRICSEASAQRVLQMMEAAVTDGTARQGAIEGVRVGAKTGTAQKWDPVTHSFPANKYLASFVLICPIDNPQFVVYVAVDEPQVGQHGSDVAGPAAQEIADFAMRNVAVNLTTP